MEKSNTILDYDMPSVQEDATETIAVLNETTNEEIGPVIMIVILIVLTIGLIFGMAIFMDCRHKPRIENGEHQNRKIFNFKLPHLFKFKRFTNEEEETYGRSANPDV